MLVHVSVCDGRKHCVLLVLACAGGKKISLKQDFLG